MKGRPRVPRACGKHAQAAPASHACMHHNHSVFGEWCTRSASAGSPQSRDFTAYAKTSTAQETCPVSTTSADLVCSQRHPMTPLRPLIASK